MTKELLTEIDSLIEAVSSKLPGSMSNKENLKLEAAFKKSMANYFDSLSDAFPYSKLDELYSQTVKEDAASWADWDDAHGKGEGGGGNGQSAKVDTDSKDFKEWFGNSKIVDSDGKPLIVYHGTHDIQPVDLKTDIVNGEVVFHPTFDQFNEVGRTEPGMYFTPDIRVAKRYGTPIPYYLKASSLSQKEDPLTSIPNVDAIYRMRGKGNDISKAFEIAVFDKNNIMPLYKRIPLKLTEAMQQVKEVAPPKPKAPPAGEWDAWLNALTNAFKAQLGMSISQHLVQIYVSGSLQMMSYGKTKLGIPILFEGPPMSQAVNWARDYGAGLVTNMDIETRSRLAQVISDGIQNKRGVEGISRDIRKEFTDMSKARADMIAQTETNNALSQAAMDKMQEMGVDGKEWIVVGDDLVCEICNGNEADGVIPIDQPFSSGDMQPTGHVNCRCTLSPARLGRTD